MEHNREQSEFNMVIEGQKVVRAILNQCIEASIVLDAYQWYQSIWALIRECAQYMKPEEVKEKEQELTLLAADINIWNKNNLRSGYIQMANHLYKKLHDTELYLRNVLKESGKLERIKEDPSTALANG